MSLHFVEKQRRARRDLETLMREHHNVLLVHYASEGIVEPLGKGAPRIAAVVVRNLRSGQTRSFSAHLVAEELLRPIENYWAAPDIEHKLLSDFFGFAKEKSEAWWVHWNMRDASFGFQALEHRFKVLGGDPFVLNSARMIDLSRLMVDLYGSKYMAHPRMQRLMERNGIDRYTFLTGAEEAQAFLRHEIASVHQSTLRKVSVFEHFLELAHDRRLKTNATWWDQHGGTVRASTDWLVSHPWVVFLLAVVGVVLGVFGLF